MYSFPLCEVSGTFKDAMGGLVMICQSTEVNNVDKIILPLRSTDQLPRISPILINNM